jgi:hypothetical protein
MGTDRYNEHHSYELQYHVTTNLPCRSATSGLPRNAHYIPG